MTGHMPPEVLNNARVGLQSADVLLRIRENFQKFSSALVEIEKSEDAKNCLDFPKLNTLLHNIQKNNSLQLSVSCGICLTRGLGVGLFLTR